MALNRSRFSQFLTTIAILGACITAEVSLAGDQANAGVADGTPAAPVEDSATVWDRTKDGSARTWGKTKEVSGDAWDATRKGSARAWGKTKEVSSNVWDATRKGSIRAWGKTKTTVQGWREDKPESETDPD